MVVSSQKLFHETFIMNKIIFTAIVFTYISGFNLQANAECVSGNCKSGKGTFIFKNGSRYKGSFKKSFMHGQGVYLSKNGDRYEGQYSKGLMHGKGVYSKFKGGSYAGEFKNGRMNGSGTWFFFNGDKYTGTWVNNFMSGKGILEFELHGGRICSIAGIFQWGCLFFQR